MLGNYFWNCKTVNKCVVRFKASSNRFCNLLKAIYMSRPPLSVYPTNAGRTFLSPIFVKFGYVINSREINTLYFAKKFENEFYSANIWLFRKNTVSLNVMQFFYSSSNIIVFYIILKLRTPRTQNFLKYRNILSDSRNIRKRRKNKKILKLRFFDKIGPF